MTIRRSPNRNRACTRRLLEVFHMRDRTKGGTFYMYRIPLSTKVNKRECAQVSKCDESASLGNKTDLVLLGHG